MMLLSNFFHQFDPSTQRHYKEKNNVIEKRDLYGLTENDFFEGL